MNIRSIRLMAEKTLVSFRRKITFAVKPGMLTETAWGSTTSRRAFHLGFLHRFQSAPEHLCHVGAAQQPQSQNPAQLRAELDPQLRECEIQEEQLHQERCVAEQLDIGTCQLPQHRYPKMSYHCGYKPDQEGQQDAQPSDPEGQPQGLFKQGKIVPHHFQIHTLRLSTFLERSIPSHWRICIRRTSTTTVMIITSVS